MPKISERQKRALFSILPPDYETKSGPYSTSVSGAKLREAGFSFFDSKRNYYFGKLDSDGLVCVWSLSGHIGQDEDGYGEAHLYDWWYLTEDLCEVPGAGYLRACTFTDVYPEELNRYHDKVVALKRAGE